MGRVPPPRRDEFVSSTLEKTACDRNQASVTQIWLDQITRHVSPAHALENEFLLHQLVADGPASGTLDQKIVRRWRIAGGIADHALHVVAHLLRRNRRGNGKPQASSARALPEAEKV